jgi:sugar-specific transcriptional regulator TrmB
MIVLFCKKEVTAKDICAYIGIGHTKVYQVLKSLEDKGFVKYNFSKPRAYKGKNAAGVMNKLIGRKEKIVEKLKVRKQETLNQLRKMELIPVNENSKQHPMWDLNQYKIT